MARLPEIQRLLVILAVGTVVADGLHLVLIAGFDHQCCIRPGRGRKLGNFELVCGCLDVVLCTEIDLEIRLYAVAVGIALTFVFGVSSGLADYCV